MKNHYMSLCLIVPIALILMASQGFVQIKTGTIRVTVNDETGILFPGVTVEIRGEVLMGSRTIITAPKASLGFLLSLLIKIMKLPYLWIDSKLYPGRTYKLPLEELQS